MATNGGSSGNPIGEKTAPVTEPPPAPSAETKSAVLGEVSENKAPVHLKGGHPRSGSMSGSDRRPGGELEEGDVKLRRSRE